MTSPQVLTGLYVCIRDIKTKNNEYLYGRVGAIGKKNKKTEMVIFYPVGGHPHRKRVPITSLCPFDLTNYNEDTKNGTNDQNMQYSTSILH